MHKLDIGKVVGSSLGKHKLKFLFAKNFFWHNCERAKTLVV